MKSLATLTMTLAALAATSEAEDSLSLLQTSAMKRQTPWDNPLVNPPADTPRGCCGTGSDPLGEGDPDIEQKFPDPPHGNGEALPDTMIRRLPDPKKKSKYFVDGADVPEIALADPKAVDFQCKGGKGKWLYTGYWGNGPRIDLTFNIAKVQQIYTAVDTGFKHAVPWDKEHKWSAGKPELIDLGEVKDEKDCVQRARLDAGCHELVETDLYAKSIWLKDASGQNKQPRNENTYLNPEGRLGNVAVFFNTVQNKAQPVNRCKCGTVLAGVDIMAQPQGPGKPGTWICQLNPADMGITFDETPEGLKLGEYPMPGDDVDSGKPEEGEPKKQSKMTGEVEIVTAEVDFLCDGGKGKWVYMQKEPASSGSPPRYTDLSEKTTNILEFEHNDYNGQTRARPKPGGEGSFGNKYSWTERGPVKDEKDCYNRAKQDFWCNHWAEDQVYSETAPVLGVWYSKNGYESSGWRSGTCGCGNPSGGGHWGYQAGKSGKVPVGDTSANGMWYCKFMDADRLTEEELNEKKAKEEFSCDLCAESENDFDPEGKKGKCQRIFDRAQKNTKRCEKRKGRPGVIRGCCPSEACKSARESLADARAARDAAKQAVTDAKASDATKADLKALRAELKAARAALKAARAAKQDACGRRKSKES